MPAKARWRAGGQPAAPSLAQPTTMGYGGPMTNATAQYSSILRQLAAEKFVDILGASPRKAREGYFHRHGIKPPKTHGLPKAGRRHEAGAQELWQVFKAHDDEELAEAILRVWLLDQRPMLAAALDHLGIAHNDGLTDSDDVERFVTLNGAALDQLYSHLCTVAPAADVRIYLLFMGCTDAARLAA